MQDLKTRNLKELEVAVLFWAGGDPEKTLEPLMELGAHLISILREIPS